MVSHKPLIIDELGLGPLSETGAERLFELISQRYEPGATLITRNLPFEEWRFANVARAIGVPLAHPSDQNA